MMAPTLEYIVFFTLIILVILIIILIIYGIKIYECGKIIKNQKTVIAELKKDHLNFSESYKLILENLIKKTKEKKINTGNNTNKT